MRKVLCWLGFHNWKPLAETAYGLLMTLCHDKCICCGKRFFYYENLCGRVPLNEEQYKALLKSMGQVSDICQGAYGEPYLEGIELTKEV